MTSPRAHHALTALLAVTAVTACQPASSPETRGAAQPVTAAAPSAVERVRAALRPDARQAVDSAPVPVLLPADVALAPFALVTTGERWAAVSIPRGSFSIALHAARPRPIEVVGAPPAGALPPPPGRVRGVPATITVNEGIRVVSWEERGVAYSLEIECHHHQDDARCTEEGFARSLAESLVVAGGNGGAQ